MTQIISQSAVDSMQMAYMLQEGVYTPYSNGEGRAAMDALLRLSKRLLLSCLGSSDPLAGEFPFSLLELFDREYALEIERLFPAIENFLSS